MTEKTQQALGYALTLAGFLLALVAAVVSAENRFVHEARYGEDQRRQAAVAENEQRRNDARMERLEMKIDRLLERSDGNAR